MDNDNTPSLENLVILGVLQRLALCYFFTAVIILFVPATNDKPNAARSANSKIGKWDKHLVFELLSFEVIT
jgi:predicted acyltransferase